MGMRAITVSVDYADILRLCLPRNRHHFDEVMIVTSPNDFDTMEVAVANDCRTFKTNAFYEKGAWFNKWAALEQALEEFGRHGWMVLIDADVVWPRELPEIDWQPGNLYTPLCRMTDKTLGYIPAENRWGEFRLRGNQGEWAGYTQIFHASDSHLGNPPWHQLDWKHAGGADSYFQFKWPKANKIRPPFEVLHIGVQGRNWCGRSTERTDGDEPTMGQVIYEQFREMRLSKNERIA